MPDNMVGQLIAYIIVLWLCPVGPILLVWLGIAVGHHGWKHVITVALLKIFGVPKEGLNP